jgi:hypothetical protein
MLYLSGGSLEFRANSYRLDFYNYLDIVLQFEIKTQNYKDGCTINWFENQQRKMEMLFNLSMKVNLNNTSCCHFSIQIVLAFKSA